MIQAPIALQGGITGMIFNFFASSRESDKELFFGPLEGEEFIIIEEGWTMANIVHIMGIFPSITQARNNGYNKPIPEGFTHKSIGKLKYQAYIFKEKL